MFPFRRCAAFAFLALMLAAAQNPSAPEKRIAVTVDAAKTAAPVSPYLYGQFIEHIADTVNRSVWAEMIDDRKFYYAMDSKTAAPAASRGRRPTRGVPSDRMNPSSMDSEHAYTGEHSPLIKLDGAAPRGVAQAGVVLKKGRAYSGRVVLAGDAGANVTVSLVWGSGPNDRQTVPIKGLKSDVRQIPAELHRRRRDATDGRIEIAGTGRAPSTSARSR